MHINGECYVEMPNGIFYSKFWMQRIIGIETTMALFNFCEKYNQLKLTNCEKAILFPLIITNYGID
jgi:hypothetical protein